MVRVTNRMVLTNDVYLPSEEELTVPEVNLSGPALRAGAFHLGKACEAENNVSICSIGILVREDCNLREPFSSLRFVI